MQRKNRRISPKIFIYFFTISLLGTLVCCDSPAEKGPQLVRIIDILSEEHIVKSPFRNIFDRFHNIEERLTGKWTYLPDLSSQSQEIWGTSSRHPILGNHESLSPEGMALLKNGKPVEYLSGEKNQKKGWRWIGTSETLDLRTHKDFDNTRRGIILNREKSFQFEKLIPEGNLILDLYIVNPDWQKVRPVLKVTFNGKDEEELVISSRKWFRIRKNLPLGKYAIEIKYDDNNEPPADEAVIVLGQVKMTGSSDVLLLIQPRQDELSDPQGDFVFQYHTHVRIPEKELAAVSPQTHYLYNIRNKFPLFDDGAENNPYSIKKKISFDEYSLNSLVAPPESEFDIEMKIPPNALLEFGYGILNEFKNRETKQSFQFRLLLKRSGEEKLLFDRTISWETTKDIIQEQIDLSPYAGDRVRLLFQTSDVDKDSLSQIVPVWVNPLVFEIPETDPTNIILISLDTVRPDHLGCYGYDRNTSPSIDQLASDGVLFENTYSTASWTLPGHVSMMTSMDCLNHQVYFPLQKMGTEVLTIADILRTRGFYCAAFTGGGYLSETYGFSKGFDSYQEIKLHGDRAIRLDEAERLAQLASRWLEDNAKKNFFLFLHTYQPHDPYANLSPLGKEFLSEDAAWDEIRMETLFEGAGRFGTQFTEKEKKNIIALYDGEIKYTDVLFVQPIVDKLKELGLYEKSLVILTSDHGEEFYDHEAWLHDHSVYDESIRIPLIVKFPGADQKGTRIRDIARITDILPTILDHLDMKSNIPQFDGASLLPLIEGKEKKQRTFISDLALREFETAPTVISANKDNFKLILNKKIVSPYIRRSVRNFDGSQIELYDLENDAGETKNLAANIAFRDLCFELLDLINGAMERSEATQKQRDEVTLDSSLKERLRALGYIK